MPIFNTPFEQYRERQGQACTILRAITEPDDKHDSDVLPMFAIRFDGDGFEAEAWPEELAPDVWAALYDDENKWRGAAGGRTTRLLYDTEVEAIAAAVLGEF